MSEAAPLPDAGLSGRNALVTGGSRGIGRAIVERLAGAGMDVTFTYLGNEAAANEVIAANPGLKITALKVDARESGAVNQCVEALVERVGTIDVLVNNAGVIRDHLLPMLEDAETGRRRLLERVGDRSLAPATRHAQQAVVGVVRPEV